ncbi:phosphoribosylglycinamide formyltransferase [Streptomyces cinnamoneus]|uniref:Phosphoribosylglycinamide formyltransferase n=1 Tax=Streptomyces cinnamoneus TaxID=53446 RepID=A0A918TT43_STRCJ|nr:phosphoribosylglycinamide formyltransferase [Streptomyces cinnamoneus]
MPVSLLAVGGFVESPVFGDPSDSYDHTNRATRQNARKGPVVAAPARIVALVSGSGTNLQALLDAIAADPDGYGARIVAVGADRDGIAGLERAERAGLPTFVCRVQDHPTRDAWDRALAEATAAYEPDLVVSAGFMKILGKDFLARFGGRIVNTHPALLPSFPGAHGVRDALAYGVRVTGCTVHFVDEGVDTGPIIAQGVVEVRDEDDEAALHERIKEVERALLVEVVGRLARHDYRIEGRKVRIS